MNGKKCKHYKAPIHNETCEKGVNYVELTGGERARYMRKLPCVKSNLSKDVVACEKYEEYTDEELAEQERESKERWELTMQAIAEIKKSGKQRGQIECPKCKGKLGFTVSGYNGHIWGKCEKENCLSWMM